MHPFGSVCLIQVFNNRNHRSIQVLFTVNVGEKKMGLVLLSA